MSRYERDSPFASECRDLGKTCAIGGSSFAMTRTSHAAGTGVSFRPGGPRVQRTKKAFRNIAINDAASVGHKTLSVTIPENYATSTRTNDSSTAYPGWGTLRSELRFQALVRRMIFPNRSRTQRVRAFSGQRNRKALM